MSYSLALSRSWITSIGIALLSGMAMPRFAQGQASSAQLFQENFSFVRRDMMALEGGRIVAKILKSKDNREVAVLGAVHIHVPIDVLVECFRDVEAFFVDDEIVTQVGTFSVMPSTVDLEGLDLPEKDFIALRECEVGKCKVKLSRHQIERLHSQVDWSQPDYERQAKNVMADALVRNLTAYISSGNDALPVYSDKEPPLSASEDFRILLVQSRKFLSHDPGLYRYMQRFPETDLPDVESLFYWTVEDFGMKPVTSLNHMMISRRPASGWPYTTIAIKQIYASHYFQSLIKLATLAPASEQYPLRGTYLLLYSRMRFDGRVGGIKRVMLERQLKHTWTMRLKAMRERAEGKYRKIRVASRDDG